MARTVLSQEFSDLSPAVRDFISRTQKLYIDGQWVEAASGKTFESIDPATEVVICQVAEAGAEDVDRAAKAATKAFYDGEWSRMLEGLVREAVELGHLGEDLDAVQFVWQLDGLYLAHHVSQRLMRDPHADARALATFENLVASSQS